MKNKRKKSVKITVGMLKSGQAFIDSHADGRHLVRLYVSGGMTRLETLDGDGRIVQSVERKWREDEVSNFKRWFRAETGQPYVDADNNQHEGIYI